MGDYDGMDTIGPATNTTPVTGDNDNLKGWFANAHFTDLLDWGFSAGLGIFGSAGNDVASMDVDLGVRGGFGHYTDSAGEDAYGVEAAVNLPKLGLQVPDAGVGCELAGPGASLEGKMTDDMISAGATTNLLSGAATYQDDERLAKVGVGFGAGAGVRFHSSDKDGDRKTEYGVGVDVGPFSGDYKTETPGEDALSAAEYVALSTFPATAPYAAANAVYDLLSW